MHISFNYYDRVYFTHFKQHSTTTHGISHVVILFTTLVHTHVHTNFHTPHLYKYAPHYYDFCYISMLKPYHCLKYSRCTCREICLLFTTFRLHIISKIIIKCMFSNIFCINFKYGSTNIFHWKWKESI